MHNMHVEVYVMADFVHIHFFCYIWVFDVYFEHNYAYSFIFVAYICIFCAYNLHMLHTSAEIQNSWFCVMAYFMCLSCIYNCTFKAFLCIFPDIFAFLLHMSAYFVQIFAFCCSFQLSILCIYMHCCISIAYLGIQVDIYPCSSTAGPLHWPAPGVSCSIPVPLHSNSLILTVRCP